MFRSPVVPDACRTPVLTPTVYDGLDYSNWRPGPRSDYSPVGSSPKTSRGTLAGNKEPTNFGLCRVDPSPSPVGAGSSAVPDYLFVPASGEGRPSAPRPFVPQVGTPTTGVQPSPWVHLRPRPESLLFTKRAQCAACPQHGRGRRGPERGYRTQGCGSFFWARYDSSGGPLGGEWGLGPSTLKGLKRRFRRQGFRVPLEPSFPDVGSGAALGTAPKAP